MSYRCRFCGEKIASDAVSCEHCGKQLRKTSTSTESAEPQRRITNIDSWKDRTIPWWMMLLVVGFFLACFVIMFLDAADPEPAAPPSEPAQTSQPSQSQVPTTPANRIP